MSTESLSDWPSCPGVFCPLIWPCPYSLSIHLQASNPALSANRSCVERGRTQHTQRLTMVRFYWVISSLCCNVFSWQSWSMRRPVYIAWEHLTVLVSYCAYHAARWVWAMIFLMRLGEKLHGCWRVAPSIAAVPYLNKDLNSGLSGTLSPGLSACFLPSASCCPKATIWLLWQGLVVWYAYTFSALSVLALEEFSRGLATIGKLSSNKQTTKPGAESFLQQLKRQLSF